MKKRLVKCFDKKERRIYLLGALFFIVIVTLLLRLLLFHVYNFIDSDMSSELILARLLSEEHRLISPNWYYSTELRVVNTQLISTLFFCFTNNWQIVRVGSSLVLYVIYICAYLFMMKAAKVRTSVVIVTAPMLLVPFSSSVLNIIQFGLYYIPHLTLLFLSLGLYFKSEKSKRMLYLFFSAAFIMGLGGIRYLLIAGMPIMCTSLVLFMKQPDFVRVRGETNWSCIQKLSGNLWAKRFLRGLGGFVFTGAGFLFNSSFLSKWYTFSSYTSTDFIAMQDSNLSDIFSSIIADLLMLMGYRGGQIFSIKGVLNLFLFLGILLLLIYIVRRLIKIATLDFEKSFLILFFVISFLINMFIFVFVKDIYVERYFIPILLMIIPVACICLDEKFNTLDGKIGIALFLSFGILAGGITITEVCKTNNNQQRYAPIEFLLARDLKVGYATFWNANIMTELSNGELLVTGVGDPTATNAYKWLTPKHLYEKEREDAGKSFVLLTTEEVMSIEGDARYDNLVKIYQDENFTIFTTYERLYPE